jgi:hypothetical protein
MYAPTGQNVTNVTIPRLGSTQGSERSALVAGDLGRDSDTVHDETSHDLVNVTIVTPKSRATRPGLGTSAYRTAGTRFAGPPSGNRTMPQYGGLDESNG